MLKINLRYWLCQVIGWGGWSLLNLFFVYFFVSDVYLKPVEKGRIFFTALLIEFLFFILSTHLLRYTLNKLNWMKLPVRTVIMIFIVGVSFTGVCVFYGAKFVAKTTGNSIVEYEKKESLEKAKILENDFNLTGTTYYLTTNEDSLNSRAFQAIKKTGWFRNNNGNWTFSDQRKGVFWWDLIFTFILVALWLLIYILWHYIQKDQTDRVDKLMLEKTVKELELKTIKAHINPHFIFNSLNSIRALVDENPKRARTAITELSNILRSSMQVEKMETVPLHKELDIVKDYLALEQMRFEERLKVEFDIDEDTLSLPVPPMMLQTLAENAIKHGINKQINGGTIKIISRFAENDHELLVLNTGTIMNAVSDEGFGIKSTQDRLKFLYHGKALFHIRNANGLVESKVTMPLDY